MRLSNFFKSPSSWTKENDALDKSRKPYNLNEYASADFKDGNRLEAFSLQGAVAYFYSIEKEPETRYRMLDRLRNAIFRYTGKSYNVAEFNRLPETTIEDIREVVKMAEKN